MNERTKGYYLDILKMNESILSENCILSIVHQLESAFGHSQNEILLNIAASLWKVMPLYYMFVTYNS